MSTRPTTDEKTCATIFIEWLGGQSGVAWRLRRAEDRFPDLAHTNRWDFVAECRESDEKWLALEIKDLVVPKVRTQVSEWRKTIRAVNESLQGQLPGTFVLDSLPRWAFDQQLRRHLGVSLKEVVCEVAPTLVDEASQDIGSKVAERFADWPSEPADKRRPHPLWLWKLSRQGSSLGFGGYIRRASAYWVGEELDRAVDEILRGEKANKQLGVAREKGATKTALLLHDHIGVEAAEVVQALSSKDAALYLSNIDEAYLVGSYVHKVWPKTGE